MKMELTSVANRKSLCCKPVMQHARFKANNAFVEPPYKLYGINYYVYRIIYYVFS